MNTSGRIAANEKGLALMVVLVLSGIMLGIMAGLVYMLISSTQVSGVQKRYKTALEAGKGGADVAFELIGARGLLNIPSINLSMPAASLIGGSGKDCLTQKLNSRTGVWDGECSSTIDIDPGTPATYDMTFELGSTTTYRVYAKIVDTVEGNSAADIGLQKAGVVTSNSGEVMAVSRPYLYSIEVDAQSEANPSERAKYSILYQY